MPAVPSQNPRRRNARVGPQSLPAGGRSGRAPKWPLSEPTDGEKALWSELWHTPQAVLWERSGWTRTVARYARVVLQAEGPEFDAAALTQASNLEDRLGLTPKAMRLLLWTVEELEEEPVELSVVPDRWRNAAAG